MQIGPLGKTALLTVSRGFAKAAAGTGVTVNSVTAGPTHTGGAEEFVYQVVPKDLPWAEEQRQFMREHRPQEDRLADRIFLRRLPSEAV